MHRNSITKVIRKIKQLKQHQVRLNFKFQIYMPKP
jgi:Mor family transcriptional regulator